MNKFVVTLDVGTVEQRNAVTEHFKSKGWQLWHWMEDVWLLAQVPPEITSQMITDELTANPIIATKRRLVLLIPGNSALSFWGYSVPDSWKWMKEFWGIPK